MKWGLLNQELSSLKLLSHILVNLFCENSLQMIKVYGSLQSESCRHRLSHGFHFFAVNKIIELRSLLGSISLFGQAIVTLDMEVSQ